MVTKELDQYTVDCNLLLKNVTVEDAGKYKVTARNDLGESNATISLNFDSKTLYSFSLKVLIHTLGKSVLGKKFLYFQPNFSSLKVQKYIYAYNFYKRIQNMKKKSVCLFCSLPNLILVKIT